MKRLLIALICLLLLALPLPARADGIIVPEPPPCSPGPDPEPGPGSIPCPLPLSQLEIRYHHVDVILEDQVAVTHVDQVFYNPNDWTVEGIYLFPLPAEAAVTSFTLWVDGQPVEGKVLDADQARQTYEEIVRSLRDPALLEYAGRGAVQARIFPIPSRGERRIELEYTQALAAENGLVRYTYPLGTEKFSAVPLQDVAVRVEIRSSTAPIRAVYSPSHTVAVERQDERRVTATYEESNVLPEGDFALAYSLGESEAFHLLTARDPADPDDPDGFFLLLLAPRPDAAAQVQPKDLLLVLDQSGSMEGDKFRQAQEALRFILQRLNPEDRFNLVTFSSGVESFAPALRPATEAGDAIRWVDGLSAAGSTDINRALLEAVAMLPPEEERERPAYLIFLTDGLPTEGVTDSQAILDNLVSAAPPDLHLFSFGVGYDVDTFLLDSLAQAHGGSSTYVLPGERLDEILSAFYDRISTPVLTDLALDFGEVPVYDLYPFPLPDLFRGSQLVLVGRYRRGGTETVTLTGQVNGQPQTFPFPGQVFSDGEEAGSLLSASIPRLWATRKIGTLLNRVRLQGADAETVDQIVRLSIRYGIVTPYTSYLVTEPMPLGMEAQESIAEEQLNRLLVAPTAAASGQAAVEKAADQGEMAAAEAPAAPGAEAVGRVRQAGGRTFVLTDGNWVDTGFDPEKMQPVRVAFLSEEYFALSETRPDLAAAFALGPGVIALSGGTAFQVTAEGAQSDPLEGMLTPAASPTGETPLTTPPEPASPIIPAPASAPGGVPCGAALLPLVLLLAFKLKR